MVRSIIFRFIFVKYKAQKVVFFRKSQYSLWTRNRSGFGKYRNATDFPVCEDFTNLHKSVLGRLTNNLVI